MITVADVQRTIQELTAPGKPFEVIEIIVGQQRLRAFTNAPSDMIATITAGRQFSNAPFMVFEDQRYDYAHFYAEVDALAAYLQREIGVKPGDRVAIAMQNCPHWSVGFYASVLVGATVVPLNSWSGAAELDFLLESADPVCLLVDQRRYALVKTLARRNQFRSIITSQLGQAEPDDGALLFDAVIQQGALLNLSPVAVEPDDLAMVMYTSGSSGAPKGVVHTHRSVAQAIMNMMYIGMLGVTLEGVMPYRAGATGETVMLTVPLFHGTGLLSGLLLPTFIGARVVMMRKWDTETALRLIDQEKVTTMTSVPAVLRDVITSPGRAQYSIESLLRVNAGGAATPVDLPAMLAEALPWASRSAGYGMTETVAVGSQMSGAVYTLREGASGVISPIMQFRSVAADERVLGPGEEGEIQLRGVTCLKQYWRNPEATERALTTDGWLRTGDLGYVDADGFVFVTGRLKEIVIRGGENISPTEIENAVYERSDVSECVVFGVPDKRLGEELAMVVYPRPPATIDEPALRDDLLTRLAAFKVPRYIRISNEPLPRNNSEKLDKIAIKATLNIQE